MTRILFVGQKPETVDFSDPSLPPGFNADKINAGIAVAVQKIEERGWQGDTCMITPDGAGRALLKKALEGASYDCVVIGGGLRLSPKSLPLFEMVVDPSTKRRLAPRSRSTRDQRTPPRLQPANSMPADNVHCALQTLRASELRSLR